MGQKSLPPELKGKLYANGSCMQDPIYKGWGNKKIIISMGKGVVGFLILKPALYNISNKHNMQIFQTKNIKD